MKIKNMLLTGLVMLSISACGGGDNPSPNTQPLSAGTYRLTFSAISTARLDAPVSGINVAVKLPAGLSVATTTGGSGQIAVASVTPGSTVQGTVLAFGNYSVSTRTAYLSMATTQDSYRGGQFLNLLFSVAANVSVTPNDIFALNTIYSTYKVVGLDAVSHSTVVMTDKVKTTLGVVQ